MKLHSKMESSTANGPGNRAVLWFAGCTLNCTGCQNPETHSFDVPDTDITDVMEWLLTLDGIEGVTFSGGEPMQHWVDLLRLCIWVRVARPELTIGIFTGYTLRELSVMPSWKSIADNLDFAVCGRYNQLKHTTEKAMCGSSNQTLELLSTRYKPKDFSQQMTEVTLDEETGLIQISGHGATFSDGI